MSLVITQVKSGKTVERDDSPQLRGMVHAVRHLVTVEEK